SQRERHTRRLAASVSRDSAALLSRGRSCRPILATAELKGRGGGVSVGGSVFGFPAWSFPWVVRCRALSAIVFAVMLFFLTRSGNMETGNKRYQVMKVGYFHG